MSKLIALCPKCGDDNVYLRHIDKLDEHMAAKCHRCEYRWNMKPLDRLTALERAQPKPVEPERCPNPHCRVLASERHMFDCDYSGTWPPKSPPTPPRDEWDELAAKYIYYPPDTWQKLAAEFRRVAEEQWNKALEWYVGRDRIAALRRSKP